MTVPGIQADDDEVSQRETNTAVRETPLRYEAPSSGPVIGWSIGRK